MWSGTHRDTRTACWGARMASIRAGKATRQTPTPWGVRMAWVSAGKAVQEQARHRQSTTGTSQWLIDISQLPYQGYCRDSVPAK